MTNSPYYFRVELRQLEAFVAVATDLHFGKAAERMFISQPTLSEMIRRLEREFGTELFTRTTRRVQLTAAGAELLARSKVILDDVASATAAVRRVGSGESGSVRLGMTPPVGPVLGPHLVSSFLEKFDQIDVSARRMWLHDLRRALLSGEIDAALTCGVIDTDVGVVSEVFCGEQLLIGLRPGHRLAHREGIGLRELGDDRLGLVSESLFPAWVLSQRQALEAVSLRPPTIPLEDTNVTAAHWMEQHDVDWIMLIPSLTKGHSETVVRPVDPVQLVPFSLLWRPERVESNAIERFIRHVLNAELPPGWSRLRGSGASGYGPSR
jgi:DNA-binding transcriptional LysR family regulator